MSRFLRVGLILDKIDDIMEAARLLSEQEATRADGRSRDLALDILEMAKSLKDFIERWDCEPLIYTGRGTTDEVINMLDCLLSKAEKAS